MVDLFVGRMLALPPCSITAFPCQRRRCSCLDASGEHVARPLRAGGAALASCCRRLRFRRHWSRRPRRRLGRGCPAAATEPRPRRHMPTPASPRLLALTRAAGVAPACCVRRGGGRRRGTPADDRGNRGWPQPPSPRPRQVPPRRTCLTPRCRGALRPPSRVECSVCNRKWANDALLWIVSVSPPLYSRHPDDALLLLPPTVGADAERARHDVVQVRVVEHALDTLCARA